MPTTLLSPSKETRADQKVAHRPRWAPLPIVLAGTFMMVLDFFIVNVAVPTMQRGLHASNSDIVWVVAGYGLATAVFLITGARLGDRVGRVRIFTIGLAAFTVSSAACGLAQSPAELLVARLCQGASAALIEPNVMAIITSLYDDEQRPKALAAFGMSMGIAAVFGQLIGGALLRLNVFDLGWRACFLINVPVGALAVVAAPRLIPESRSPAYGDLDLGGTALATGGLIAIVLPLIEGRGLGWPLWTWLSLGASPLILAAFVLRQRRIASSGGSPLLPLQMFQSRTTTVGLLAQLLFWCGQASCFLVLALYLQLGRGLTALDAGLLCTISAVSYVLASIAAPALSVRHGRRVLATGALLLAVGHATLLTAVLLGGPLGTLVPGLVVAGTGMGLAIATVPGIVLGSTAPEHVGSASGLLATVQYVGSAVGVAAISTIFFGRLSSGYSTAFAVAEAALAGILLVVALLSRLLPAAVRS